ncbi:MAG TPA: GntR family transcriptional regulator [Ramlibacter sp.]|nr:GntR family transcriptional regulator [Ramlibacter sp.]
MAKPEESPFRAVVTVESVRRQVENELRRAIVQGRFPPGTHLSDRLLQDTFQVSRTVIREAVRQVEAEGLIETLPHRGSFVKALTVREAEQVYAVRGVLEGLAAREFARRAEDPEIDELERIVKKIRKHLNRRQLHEIIDLKHEFYDLLLTGCRNTHVKAMLAPLLNINAQLRATSLSDPARLPHTVAELEQLVDAIKRRDEDAAWAASLQHVHNAAAVALKLLKARDSVAASSAPSRRKGDLPVMAVS